MPKLARRPDADSPPRCIGEGSASFSSLSRPILAETEWSFTLPTRRAPMQPARPTACSLQANTLHAMGAPGNGGLALFSNASGSAWQPPPGRPNHIPQKTWNTLYLARAFGAMYDLLLGKGALPCPFRNSRNSSTGTTLNMSVFPTRSYTAQGVAALTNISGKEL